MFTTWLACCLGVLHTRFYCCCCCCCCCCCYIAILHVCACMTWNYVVHSVLSACSRKHRLSAGGAIFVRATRRRGVSGNSGLLKLKLRCITIIPVPCTYINIMRASIANPIYSLYKQCMHCFRADGCHGWRQWMLTSFSHGRSLCTTHTW